MEEATLTEQLETLRLYPPVVSIPKLTPPSGAELVYNDETIHLPPNVRVNLNCNALHNSEEYWGPDVGTWNPRRWDKRNPDSFLARNDGVDGLSGPGLESQSIHKPHRGAFIPFSDGMRACVGRKFAQAEFVAALVVIFRKYRVTPATLEGESIQDAKKRTERALQESSTFLTLSLTEKVPLRFEQRAIA
jgi:cytochrome P450